MLRILKQSSHIQQEFRHVFFNKNWGAFAEFPQLSQPFILKMDDFELRGHLTGLVKKILDKIENE